MQELEDNQAKMNAYLEKAKFSFTVFPKTQVKISKNIWLPYKNCGYFFLRPFIVITVAKKPKANPTYK